MLQLLGVCPRKLVMTYVVTSPPLNNKTKRTALGYQELIETTITVTFDQWPTRQIMLSFGMVQPPESKRIAIITSIVQANSIWYNGLKDPSNGKLMYSTVFHNDPSTFN